MTKHTFKIITLAIILSISAVLVSAASANASSSFTFEVDFDFQIGNTKYSKGKYRVSRKTQTVLLFENLTEGKSRILLATPSNDRLSAYNESRLVFHKYGQKYFLRKVSAPAVSAKVGMSRDEKEARRIAGDKLAKVKVDNYK